MPGFENINLELISLIYQIKIKVYSINWDDLTLQAMIVNNGFEKKIEIFKNIDSDNYETVYPIDYMRTVSFCQNIIFNMLNAVLNKEKKWKNINNNMFINIEYENWCKKMVTKNKKALEEHTKILRPRHKKSLSDTINKISFDDFELNN